jgi:(1->4)-alpha-D-glucan 1-alpha-D-glucosylmutase
MAENQVLSYRVLYFEKEHDRFRRPADYPALAAACVATHDLATLKGFWDGEDIAAKVRLGVIASDDEAARARAEREADKRGLLQALADEALLPAGVDWAAAQSAELRDDLARAIYAYLARSRASLFMIQLDDLVGERRQANLPGTIDEYPNWRRRVSQGLDELGHDHRVAAMAEIITHERDQRDAPS